MSFDFDTLIRSGRGLASAMLSDVVDEVVAAAPSPLAAAWRLWAHGEALLRDDDYMRARRWMAQAAEAASTADRNGGELWCAEHATSFGHVELMLGEPGSAVAWNEEALHHWEEVQTLLSGDPATAAEPLGLQVERMWESLALAEQVAWASNAPIQLMLAWTNRYASRRHECVFRLLTALAEAHDPLRATAVVDQHVAWMQPRIQAKGQRPWLYDTRMKLGDVHSAVGAHREAAGEYDRAAALLGEVDQADHDALERLAYARFNAANELTKAGETADAVRHFHRVRSIFQQLGDTDAILRVDHALLRERWKSGIHAGLDTELRELLERYEALLSTSLPEDPVTPTRRENMAQAQRLLLSIVTARARKEGANPTEVIELLDELRKSQVSRAGDRIGEWKAFVPGVMEVVTRRAVGLSDTCVLVIEGSVGSVTLVAIGRPAGTTELTTVAAEGGDSLLTAAQALLQAARDTADALVTGSLPLRSSASQRMRALAHAVWREIPINIAELVRRCRTLVFVPDIRTGLDELPIELVHNGQGWLGLEHRVVRAPSPSHVSNILAPNAVPSGSDASAYILRAEDPAELGQLLTADHDAARAQRAIAVLLGLTTTLDNAPQVEDALAHLQAGHQSCTTSVTVPPETLVRHSSSAVTSGSIHVRSLASCGTGRHSSFSAVVWPGVLGTSGAETRLGSVCHCWRKVRRAS